VRCLTACALKGMGVLRVLSGGLQVACRVHLERSVEACRLGVGCT
jgi:hypothetical protein